MRGSRWFVLAATLALIGTVLPSVAGAHSQPLESTEVGVSEDTIRIAVIADVDNAARPGLFQGSVNGVEAFAKFVNKKKLAGRRVQVDFIDSRLSQDEARNAVIKACQEDFALVGTTALFMSSSDPATSCPDKAGKITGLPDIPVFQTEIPLQCSPISYPVIAPGIDCQTKDDPEPTFAVPLGQIDYFRKRFKGLHGIFLEAGDLKSTTNLILPVVRAIQQDGIKSDGEFKVSGIQPRTAYTPYVQAIKDADSTYALNGSDYKAGVFLRTEAQAQGVSSVKVWDCIVSCYDRRFLSEGGAAVEGQFVTLFFIPFEEAKQNKSVNNFLKNVGGIEKADGFGAQAWTAGLYFRDVVNNLVSKHGNNGLTRERFLAEAAKIHDFTADGMLGPTDVGRRLSNGCFMTMQVKGDKFVRVHPSKKGTLDCSAKPRTIKVDLE